METSNGAYRPQEDEGWADYIARCFHTEYERLAPSFGYRTREDSGVAWGDVPETNKRLMRSVVASLMANEVLDLGNAWLGPMPSAPLVAPAADPSP